MYSWALTGLLVFFAYTVASILKWKRGKNLRHLPTFPYLPFVGNMHVTLGDGKQAFQTLNEISERVEETNLPFLLWAGIHPTFFISNPNDVKMVCSTFIEKPYYYNFARIWLGDGLVTAPGYIWKKNIKRVAGTFTTEVINSYQDMFNVQAKKLVEKLMLQAGCAPFNAMPILACSFFETVCQSALGIPEISNSIVTEEYYKAFNIVLKEIIARLLNFMHHPECVFKYTRSYKMLKENVSVLHNVSEAVLQKRKQERLELESKGVSDNENSKPRVKTFLDLMLDVRKTDDSFSEEQIKSEIDTIILAAQESNATTLLFSLIIIGSRKDVHDKLYKEMKEVFGDSKRDVLKEDLDRMVYCDAFIHEILRLYPPVPAVIRKIEQDLKLESCTLPKGATCFINMWGSGRSKRVWGEDALEFRPERWYGPTPPLLAFSVGKRACIGKKYTMSLVKTFLIHCIREMVITSEPEKLEFGVDLLLRAYRGNLIQVQLREEK